MGTVEQGQRDQEARDRQRLVARIRARRADIRAFVRRVEPRASRLANVTIIASALVTAFTAGPAIGGEKFTAGVQGAANLGSDSLVWRTLCFGAVICSLVSIIATNMAKGRDIANQLNKAEACNAALEGLETRLEFGDLAVADGLDQYQQHLAEIPFIPERTGTREARAGRDKSLAPSAGG